MSASNIYEYIVRWLVESWEYGLEPKAVAMTSAQFALLSEDDRPFRLADGQLLINYNGRDVRFFERRP